MAVITIVHTHKTIAPTIVSPTSTNTLEAVTEYLEILSYLAELAASFAIEDDADADAAEDEMKEDKNHGGDHDVKERMGVKPENEEDDWEVMEVKAEDKEDDWEVMEIKAKDDDDDNWEKIDRPLPTQAPPTMQHCDPRDQQFVPEPWLPTE